MITERILNLAYVINKPLARDNKTIALRPGSPLGPILQFVAIPDVHTVEAIPATEHYTLSKIIASGTRNISYEDENGDYRIAYDTAMDNAVKEYAPDLKRYVSVLRSIINPFIRELGERVSQDINSDKLSTEDITVEEAPLPDILRNSDFLELARRYADIAASDGPIPLRPTLPPLDETQIRALILTFKGFEQDISKWLADNGDDLDVKVYNDIFRHQIRHGGSMTEIFNRRGTESLNYAIGSFLIASALLTDPIEGAQSSLDEYNDGLALIRDQAALGICNYMKFIKVEAESGTLVREYSQESVVVNPLVFRKWVSEGGDVKALRALTLGKVKGFKNRITVEEINLEKDHLEDTWDNHVDAQKNKMTGMYFDKIKSSYKHHFPTLLNKYSELGGDGLGVTDDEARERFRQELETLKGNDFRSSEGSIDTAIASARLVCRSKYPDLQADTYLMDIEQAYNENPDILIGEAALIATIKFVARWVAKDLYIVEDQPLEE